MDWGAKLRGSLLSDHVAWSDRQGIPYYLSRGQRPTVLFERTMDDLSHGNFHPESWHEIIADRDWRLRCEKTHTQRHALPQEKQAGARELDSSNSSDALLMNCFCFPGAAPRILQALGLPEEASRPDFGFKSKLPLVDGREDATEVDMQIGSVLFEAKLTERDFTTCPRPHVERYRDLETHFDVDRLPTRAGEIAGYQLVRNVLAAAHYDAWFVVLLDQRRPDLLLEWWRVHAAIRSIELRSRCEFRTWQQVVVACPTRLAGFLAEKYGL
jgi:hypothetical protein